jgi:hypothetical protein
MRPGARTAARILGELATSRGVMAASQQSLMVRLGRYMGAQKRSKGADEESGRRIQGAAPQPGVPRKPGVTTHAVPC